MSVKQVNLGNLKRKLCKIKEFEFPLIKDSLKCQNSKTKTVAI